MAGILDDGARRYEPQGIDGFGCHHGILLHLVIFELFVKLLIVQMRGFGQELLGLGVIDDPYHIFYLILVFYPFLNLFGVPLLLEVFRIVC